MTDVASWIVPAIGAIALVFTYLSYRSQLGRTRLEYVVLTNTTLIPAHLASELQVSHNGRALTEPALCVVRVVNTGDRSIKPSDFETDLVITLEGARELASATWTTCRPADLRPPIELVADRIEMTPTLINPGDGLQLQVLSAGQASKITVAGRVSDLQISQRASLPYPPGSGEEGEMLGFDRFMWFFVSPAIILGVAVFAASSGDISVTARALILVAAAIMAGVLYPLHVRHLVRRRRLWRL